MTSPKMDIQEKVDKYNDKLEEVRKEIRKGLVGQDEVVNTTLKTIICNGHVLFESVPGLAKTFLVRLITSTIAGVEFHRIQFTPDLLPTDVTGTSVYEANRGFYTIKGPIFSNFVLADEINRAPPKVQSAMLQAMEERKVTIGKETFTLPEPFCVLATQNPLEQAGVYPLALAQIDRFLFKIFVDYPKEEEEVHVLEQNVDVKKIEDFGIKNVLTREEILDVQALVRTINLSHEVKQYIMELVDATRDPAKYGIKESAYVMWGASPRASINLGLAAKATALMNHRSFVLPEDVRAIAHEVLRHRIMLNYEGKAKGIGTDQIVNSIINKVPVI
ncbi:MAG: MoxR family ATPase [Candidatus Altiarchaeota archaeon]|nr:MoxR family ATPase [Candidatus Altiarchaeota archaeon]